MALILILVFFSLASAYYFNSKAKMRRDNRREKMKEMQEKLLETLRRKKDIKEDQQE